MVAASENVTKPNLKRFMNIKKLQKIAKTLKVCKTRPSALSRLRMHHDADVADEHVAGDTLTAILAPCRHWDRRDRRGGGGGAVRHSVPTPRKRTIQ